PTRRTSTPIGAAPTTAARSGAAPTRATGRRTRRARRRSPAGTASGRTSHGRQPPAPTWQGVACVRWPRQPGNGLDTSPSRSIRSALVPTTVLLPKIAVAGLVLTALQVVATAPPAAA